MVLAACGPQVDQSAAGSIDDPEFTPPALATVIEPGDVLVLNFGARWSMTDRWNIEDVLDARPEDDTVFESACPEFNELQQLNYEAIYTELWQNGPIQMSQTVAGLGRDAETYIDNAASN